jgi:CDP-diacylglycerol---glycerol-3-phosphate 3-phosphatidyltransferase
MKRQVIRTPTNLKEEIWNLPNVLTLGRILVIPFVVWLMLLETRESALYACLLFSAAAITDFLDGFIARRRGLVTLWGQFLDPLADKLIVMATTVAAVGLDRLPVGLVVLLLTREIGISALRGMAASEGMKIAVIQTGKWKTATQLIGVIAILIGYPYHMNYLVFEEVVDFVAVGNGLLWISVTLSLYSGLQYLTSFITAISAKQEYEPAQKRWTGKKNQDPEETNR